jgi:hypothetical protein
VVVVLVQQLLLLEFLAHHLHWAQLLQQLVAVVVVQMALRGRMVLQVGVVIIYPHTNPVELEPLGKVLQVELGKMVHLHRVAVVEELLLLEQTATQLRVGQAGLALLTA